MQVKHYTDKEYILQANSHQNRVSQTVKIHSCNKHAASRILVSTEKRENIPSRSALPLFPLLGIFLAVSNNGPAYFGTYDVSIA